jgi:Protein of unknown function (DUF3592)
MDTNFSSIGAATIPSELTGPLPRRSRLSGNGSQMAIVAALMLALAVAFALWVGIDRAQQLQHRAALRHDGQEAVGDITRLWSSGRSLKTRVSYTFIANGISFKGEARVPGQLVHSLRESDTVPIRYLPANPSVNHPAAWEWSALLDWDSFVAPIIGVALCLFLIVPLRSEHQLVAEGLPVAGVITQCSPGKRGGFSVTYDFRTQDGSVTKGNGWSRARQEVGATVCVLYLPHNPRRNEPYPSLNYRVVQ